MPLESLLLEAVQHENKKILQIIEKSPRQPNFEYFVRDIETIQFDRQLSQNQIEIINDITERFCLPKIDIKTKAPSPTLFDEKNEQLININETLKKSCSTLEHLTIGQRRQVLINRAKFIRQKWQPNLNIFANDNGTFKDSFTILCSIRPQLDDILANVNFLQQFNSNLSLPKEELLRLKNQLRSVDFWFKI